MKNLSLAMRLVFLTLLAVFIACLLCAGFAWRIASNWIYRDAAEQAGRQSAEAISQLSTIDQLSRAQLESGARILQDQSRLTGIPSLQGSATLAGKAVPALRLGSESEVMNFAMEIT
jgi:hypothetical protein